MNQMNIMLSNSIRENINEFNPIINMMNQNIMNQNMINQNINQNNMNQNLMKQNMMNQNGGMNQNMINQNAINKNQNMVMPKNINNQNNIRPTQTKLEDLGDTSYLNSVLQLLGSFKEFAKFFLKKENQDSITDNIKQQPLSFVIYRLFFHLYPEEERHEIYKPDSLLEVLGLLNKVYKSRNSRNPNDLISFILNTLHKELIKKQNIKNEVKNINISNKDEVIKSGVKDFMNYNRSLISEVLNWFEIKQSKCTNCNTLRYYFYTFNTFELDILETYKNKKSNLTVNDCLIYFGKEKVKKLFCQKCNHYTETLDCSKIFTGPNIFIFSLNRGDFKNPENELVNIPFYIEENINLSAIIERKHQLIINYELTGIVSGFKKNNKWLFGSFCKSPYDQNWYYYFNDKNIQELSLNDILEKHNNNNNFIPCILVYKLIPCKK